MRQIRFGAYLGVACVARPTYSATGTDKMGKIIRAPLQKSAVWQCETQRIQLTSSTKSHLQAK